MDLSGWIMLAAIFWGYGFLQSKFGTSLDGEYLIVPKWIYILICGFPNSSELPRNAVTATGFRAQIIGWLLLIYSVLFRNLIFDMLLSFIVGFVGSALLSFFLSTLIAKR